MSSPMFVIAMVGVSALCGCASTATSQSRPMVTSVSCAGRAIRDASPTVNACDPAGKRTYSQADLQSTGKTNVGDALSMLDPSVTVSH